MRIAFDLDETLGVPCVDETGLTGFRWRTGAEQLLKELAQDHYLILWSVSQRTYIDKVLQYGLQPYFKEHYSWNERPCEWKDIRTIQADCLIDDSPYYQQCAALYGLEKHYCVVPAYGSPEDNANERLWVTQIKHYLQDLQP